MTSLSLAGIIIIRCKQKVLLHFVFYSLFNEITGSLKKAKTKRNFIFREKTSKWFLEEISLSLWCCKRVYVIVFLKMCCVYIYIYIYIEVGIMMFDFVEYYLIKLIKWKFEIQYIFSINQSFGFIDRNDEENNLEVFRRFDRYSISVQLIKKTFNQLKRTLDWLKLVKLNFL